LQYISHLGKDKQLKKLIEAYLREQKAGFQLSRRKNLHLYLCASILSQQLSTKVADTIYARFLNLFGNKDPLPSDILSTPVETLRSIGLSNAKASYVHNVSRFAIEQGMDHEKLSGMNNEEVIEYLTRIKGVGRWTVEMLLMFSLGREDVFSIDDLGIRNAMIGLYKLDDSDKKALREELLRISGKWSPYRTYACLHLWRWKDNIPGKEKASGLSGKRAAAAVKKPSAGKGGKQAAGSTEKKRTATGRKRPGSPKKA